MALTQTLAKAIERLSADQARVLVAVDGPDAAGKTTMADEVVRHLTVPWMRASIDGFHRPREARAKRGVPSPEGYFRDSFDYAALIAELLTPFRSDGKRVRTKVFDWRTDAPVEEASVAVPERALMRDVGAVGTPDEVRRRYEARYLPGQALYQSECDPERQADLVVDNSDFSNPVVVTRRS